MGGQLGICFCECACIDSDCMQDASVPKNAFAIWVSANGLAYVAVEEQSAKKEDAGDTQFGADTSLP
jgi:hypothetical protein